MLARKGSNYSRGRLGNEARKNLPEPKTRHIRPTSIGGGMTQRVGCLVYINLHMGRLSDKVRTPPHSTDSKNLLEHPPPRRQEHFETSEKVMEDSTDPNELTYSVRAPLAM
jgi:hypothetical protein